MVYYGTKALFDEEMVVVGQEFFGGRNWERERGVESERGEGSGRRNATMVVVVVFCFSG